MNLGAGTAEGVIAVNAFRVVFTCVLSRWRWTVVNVVLAIGSIEAAGALAGVVRRGILPREATASIFTRLLVANGQHFRTIFVRESRRTSTGKVFQLWLTSTVVLAAVLLFAKIFRAITCLTSVTRHTGAGEVTRRSFAARAGVFAG